MLLLVVRSNDSFKPNLLRGPAYGLRMAQHRATAQVGLTQVLGCIGEIGPFNHIPRVHA